MPDPGPASIADRFAFQFGAVDIHPRSPLAIARGRPILVRKDSPLAPTWMVGLHIAGEAERFREFVSELEAGELS